MDSARSRPSARHRPAEEEIGATETPPPGAGETGGPVIAVDAMGGDHAPREVVRGAIRAVRKHHLKPVLVGRTPELAALLAEEGAQGEVPLLHAEDALAMHEGALASWRRPRSSVAVAARLVRQGEADALVSAGTTGGVVATAAVRLRTQPGILRPALAVALPTRPHPTILLDAGANADAKPEMLVQFAQLGAAYAQMAHGVARPRIGMLTIGAEPGKGNRLVRKTTELLHAAAESQRLDFRGNIEGHELFDGAVDVVVADGFTGNVALKSVEGAVRFAFEEVRDALSSSRLARVGTLLQRKALRGLAARMDSESYGGAVLLGLNGTVVVAHGGSHAPGIERACLLAHDLVRSQVVEQVRRRAHLSGRGPQWLHRRGQAGEG